MPAAFPADGILGEEFGEQSGSSGFRWILDPIDGTKSFVSGMPLYGTLIGVRLERSLVGVIHIPALNECVYATVGHGTWYSRHDGPPKRAAVSTKQRLDQGLFCTSEIKTFVQTGRLPAFERIGGPGLAHSHLGRLLRLPVGGHWAVRGHGRSQNEPLGQRHG